MKVIWHGHSCFEIISDGMTVVTDPHDGKYLGIKPPSAAADVVIMTHDHQDHSSSRVIKGTHTDVLSRKGKFNAGGKNFEGFPTFHDTEKGTKRGGNTMYRFSADGISICHCGDIGDMPDDDVMEAIHNVDILLVPVGEVYTMNVKQLTEFIKKVEPKIIIPMHYSVPGITIPLRPVEPFLKFIRYPVENVGEEMDISAEELPKKPECWVFSR
jgi:Predicted Zn-dependent hydrolases of the beta-lactamase fold